LESLRAIAWGCLKAEKIADAESWVQKLRAASPEDPESYLLRGELARAKERKDIARDFFQKGFAAGAEEFFTRMTYTCSWRTR